MKKTGKIRLGLALAAWLAASFPLAATEAEVTAGINAEKIGLDDTLIYILTFKNINNPTQPDLSYLTDFKTLQSARSSEFQFSNGASTSSTTFTYYLMPTRTGKLSLPPVQYTHEGRDYKTQVFVVEVVKGSLNPRPAAPARQPSLFDDDVLSSPFQDRRPQTVDARLQAVISKKECYKNEQLLFRILLYTRNRIEAVNMVSSPSFAGFWQEWFPVAQTISASSENINGVVYQVFEIRKAALFPGESGTVTIPALQFELQMADPSSIFFSTQPVRRSTQAMKIKVNELPAPSAGLPVGQFSFSVTCPQVQANGNDIVTLQLRISGSGNSKTIIPPTYQNNEAVMVYPAKLAHESRFDPLGLYGTVRAELPVSFRKTGMIDFPPLEFKYFDPSSRSIVSLRSQALAIAVSGGIVPQDKSMTLPQSAIVQKGEDIDFIKDGPVGDQTRALYRQGWFAAVIALLFACNLLVLLRIILWDRYIAGSTLLKNRQLLASTLRRLARIQHYEDIAAVLEDYCQEKSGLGLADISNQKIGEWLRRFHVPAYSLDRFLFIKSQAELAKFSPIKKSQAELKSDLRTLQALVKEMDKKLK